MTNMAKSGQAQAGQIFQNMIEARARGMLENTTKEAENGMRQRLFATMPNQQAQMLRKECVDPLLQFCRKKTQETC